MSVIKSKKKNPDNIKVKKSFIKFEIVIIPKINWYSFGKSITTAF